MPNERLRLFVAVDVPRTHLEAVEAAVAPLREQFPDARWAPLANQHLTVKFLGSTPAGLRPQIEARCRAAAASNQSSEVSLAGVGAFPSARRMRVLWVGVEDALGLLPRIAATLDDEFTPLGFKAEKRAFTAHLTLARWRDPIRTEALPEIDLAELEPWTVDRIVLYRSHLSPRGATYELLDTFPLATART